MPTHSKAVGVLQAAIISRDSSAISKLLSPSVRMVIDPGGHGRQSARVLVGVADAVRMLLHGTTPAPGRKLALREVNGQAGLILMRGDLAEATIGIDFDADRASIIWIRLHPDYQRHGNRT